MESYNSLKLCMEGKLINTLTTWKWIDSFIMKDTHEWVIIKLNVLIIRLLNINWAVGSHEKCKMLKGFLDFDNCF